MCEMSYFSDVETCVQFDFRVRDVSFFRRAPSCAAGTKIVRKASDVQSVQTVPAFLIACTGIFESCQGVE